MAAYAAAVSLKNTIQCILQSSRISLVPPSPQILHQAYEAMCRLQKVLLKLDDTGYSKIRTKVNALDEQIKVAIWEFEDLLESHFTHQILPQLERDHSSFSLDLQNLRESVDNFIERVVVMEEDYDIELLNMPEEESEPISSRIDFCGINSKMVGSCNCYKFTKDNILAEDQGICLSVIGMAGVGKTTLAKKLFDDPSIQTHFELRAWVKVGRKCESNETLRCILAQLDPNTRHQMLTQGEDDDDFEKLVGVLEERLKDKKCLIVMDDVWEWDRRLMDRFPKENVRVLLTSRLRMEGFPFLRMCKLDEKESKKLLGEKLFGEHGFPSHLEKLGEKIVKKCEGLPLLIVTVAELLSKEDMTTQYWNEVAEKQHNSVFMDAYDQISEVLYPSYEYLHQHLKMFFLYLGAYPPYIDIHKTEFEHQMIAEGFLEPIREHTIQEYIKICLAILFDWYNLILHEGNLNSWFSQHKLCVHSCWQHVCKKEASKTKFLHVLKSCDEVMKDQRRLCVHRNTLFSFKEVYDSIKSDCASTARSLLCFGPYHNYPVPIHAMDFKLLKVLNAYSIRFYHIPLEIMKLVCLKYLTLTCDKDLPNLISNLFHLQTLIVRRHNNIKRCGILSYMPVEVWGMHELQHLEVVGRDLPTPNFNATLEKLCCLCSVSVKSCTREILKRIPNLKILGILMELKPYDDGEASPLSGLDNISKELQNLGKLVYYVPNPDMKYECMVPLSMFSSSLFMLELSGLGCPWKHMNDIGSLLPNLRDLKLDHYAFRGPKWDIEYGCFKKLETLVIEDTDLVQWKALHGSLPMLRLLSIRHCYKLKQLDWMRDPSMATMTTIELVECSPLVAGSAWQLQKSLFKVLWYSSFYR
ncbi:putative late blight resistance protein homolog R1A-10 isoform X1 [Salvia hispanica]|uniref:putative late blight resistance protein homolog R1A-10 isoform X1 n=1 Tax=Salvia hispanica TaxID=49212 RepID=UPI002009CE27|nr:putative late blight resistance protein homolog R1A-10 isoform X1 [Salvia hispanica]